MSKRPYLFLLTGLICVPAFSQTQTFPPDLSSQCALPAFPLPTGITDRPGDRYGNDEEWVHSSIHLQGVPALEKHAPMAFFQTTDSRFPELFGFRTGVAVHNQSGIDTVQAVIEYTDVDGNQFTTQVINIPPNGTHWELATPLAFPGFAGVGSLTVRAVDADGDGFVYPFVAATVHHTYELTGAEGETCTDPDVLEPGATSMQQLQVEDDVTPDPGQLYWGPLVASTIETEDFLERQLPFFGVKNLSGSTATVNISVFSSTTTLPTLTVSIPPFANWVDMTLFRLLRNFYAAGGSIDQDFVVVIWEDNNLPIVGEGIMLDVWSSGDDGTTTEYCGKLRMGSTMLYNQKARALTNPEFTVQNGPVMPITRTTMGIVNTALVNVGPMTLRYYDENGAQVSSFSVGSVPPGATFRIKQGQLGYPPGNWFAGWVRIDACEPGIAGWTMREIISGDQGFNKAYGETLDGSNLTEPGLGLFFDPADPNNPGLVRRKSAPLTRTPGWPGYTTFINDRVANLGNYWFRFYTFPGVLSSTPAPFTGLRWGNSSFTNEDTPLLGSASLQEYSVNVDTTGVPIKGIHVNGDPMEEWNLGFPPLGENVIVVPPDETEQTPETP